MTCLVSAGCSPGCSACLHGDLMNRFTNDIENVSTILATGFGQVISSVVGPAGVIAAMLVLNLRLEARDDEVVAAGRIVERGDHESQLARHGFYHRLYRSQFRGRAAARLP